MVQDLEFEKFQVEIEKDLVDEVQKFMVGQDKEVGGLLLGEVYFSERQARLSLLVRVKKCLWAKGVQHVRDSLKFSDETIAQWDAARQQQNDLQVVGWFHSHPGYGVYFSGNDFSNQEKYFNRPWHVAWVIDPVNQEQGVFCWQGDIMAQTESWQIVQSLGKKQPDLTKETLIKESQTGLQPESKSNLRKELQGEIQREIHRELQTEDQYTKDSQRQISAAYEPKTVGAVQEPKQVIAAWDSEVESWTPVRKQEKIASQHFEQLKVSKNPRSGFRMEDEIELQPSGGKLFRWVLLTVSVFILTAFASFGLYKIILQ